MARIVPKASRRRLTFLTPFILGVTVYFLFTIGYYGYNLISLKNEHIYLSNELLTLQSEEQKLKNDIQKLKNPEYLARYARENFLYSKDGEYIIKLEKNNNTIMEERSFLELIEDNFIYVITIFSSVVLIFLLFIIKFNRKKVKQK